MSSLRGNSHELRQAQLPVGDASQEVSRSINGELTYSFQKRHSQKPPIPLFIVTERI